jgi:hypothetical protein
MTEDEYNADDFTDGFLNPVSTSVTQPKPTLTLRKRSGSRPVSRGRIVARLNRINKAVEWGGYSAANSSNEHRADGKSILRREYDKTYPASSCGPRPYC